MEKPVKTVEIAPCVRWVGVQDWQRRMFDALIPLPYGTSYNSYLVVGKDKTALVDTVNPGFGGMLMDRVASVADPQRIDYVVMNHAEPDHAGAIPHVMAVARNATLVATRKGADMAGVFHHVPEEKRHVVKNNDTIDLGGKTLRFIEAPWLHWPETMFTFAVEDRVLMSCDFFGSHLATDRLFDDEVGDILLPEAKRYYAEIMMPFGRMVAAGLDKAKALDARVIAPSHGPVYRNPARIVDAYEKWARGPLERKAVIVYVSMWGSTAKLAHAVTSAISAEGVEAVPYDLTAADVSHIAADLVDASAVVVGSPTVLGGPHPQAIYALTLVKALRPRVKLAAYFGSYGWGGGAGSQVQGQLEPAGFEIAGVLEIHGPPGDDDLDKAYDLGRTVARRVKETA
ncbi:MAG: FprA family A-type flavoprotein [Chloroflexota bacterium]|nr:FprA family A-type flavoprotein [Chloroflexota bacterium]